MRVRVVLALALWSVLGLLGRTLLSHVPLVAGTNRVAPAAFVVAVAPGRMVCQVTAPPPPDAAVAQLTIGTYGRPVPAGRLEFLAINGAVAVTGRSAAGTPEGPISIALEHSRGAAPASRFCLVFGGRSPVVLAGVGTPPGPDTAQINGIAQAGVVSVIYDRGRPASWWSFLPSLFARFGRGKAAFFGDWTLPACMAALLALWVVTARLLARELR